MGIKKKINHKEREINKNACAGVRASAGACMCAHIGAGASAYARESYKYNIYINNMRVRERAGACGRV